jgi:hypothetical protein
VAYIFGDLLVAEGYAVYITHTTNAETLSGEARGGHRELHRALWAAAKRAESPTFGARSFLPGGDSTNAPVGR